MHEKELSVQMLGSFSLTLGEQSISDSSSRSYKMWLVLAYLLYHHNRLVKQEELYQLLWAEEDDRDDPQNAFRAIMHRVRATLSKLNVDGRQLISGQRSGYAWSSDYPVQLDIEQFDRLYDTAAAQTSDEFRLDCYLQALALYRGDFLSKLSSEAWVLPLAQYYHQRYLTMAHAAIGLLQQSHRHNDIVALCRSVLQIEAYDESLYLSLMKALLETGDLEGVVSAYNTVSKLYADNFGVMPCDEIRAVYYAAIRTVNETAIPMDTLQEQIREPATRSGAMVCEYDFFRTICHSTARLIERSGAAVHLCLLSVVSGAQGPLSKRSLELAMTNLKEQVRSNLRRGDVVSQCSPSQFVILLPMANYENSCMVCQRLIHTFFRVYPHSPVQLEYAVHPLEIQNPDFAARA